MRALAVAAVLGGAVLIGGEAGAQTASAAATYGEIHLSGGFLPDPHMRSLTAGGSIQPSVQGCSYGRIANAPDIKLFYSGNNSRTLYIYANAGTDVTLLINMPDGSWRCDDDSHTGTNPIVIVPGAPSGRYDIWVGTYGQNTAPAQLYISEINPGSGGGGNQGGGQQGLVGGNTGGGGGGGINPSANAIYATYNLNAGFLPDPQTTTLTAGGSQSPSFPGCTYGRVASSPDVKLHYSGNGGNTLYIYAQSDATDITLLINTPNGTWRCDDDSFGSGNPILVFPNAPSGRYDIWVGTYREGNASARLMISEIDPRR